MNSLEIISLKSSLEKSKERLASIHQKKKAMEENPAVAEYLKVLEAENKNYWHLKLLEESLFLGQIRECDHHMIVDNKEGRAIYQCLDCGLNNSGEEVNISGRAFTLDYAWDQAFPEGNPDIRGAYNSLDEAKESYQAKTINNRQLKKA